MIENRDLGARLDPAFVLSLTTVHLSGCGSRDTADAFLTTAENPSGPWQKSCRSEKWGLPPIRFPL